MQNSRIAFFVALTSLMMLHGCGSGTVVTQGTVGGRCYPNDTCNAGLVCNAGVCATGSTDGGGTSDGTSGNDVAIDGSMSDVVADISTSDVPPSDVVASDMTAMDAPSDVVVTPTDAGADVTRFDDGGVPCPIALIRHPGTETRMVDTSVPFIGLGRDPMCAAITGASLVWVDSLEGPIGTGESFSHAFIMVGTHTVTLTATDGMGRRYTASVTFTIVAAFNDAGLPCPSASIFHPGMETRMVGTSVPFIGRGVDPSCNSLTGAALVWADSLEGNIGTGEMFSHTFTMTGVHTVTLTASYSGGSSRATVTFTIM